MSTTVAHRSHMHIPWMTIAIVLVAALAAGAVLVLVNQPADVTVETTPVVLTAPGAAAMPQLESRAEILALTGRGTGVAAETAVPDVRHGIPVGAVEASERAASTVAPDSRPHFTDARHYIPVGALESSGRASLK
jgi:hypothetical protein